MFLLEILLILYPYFLDPLPSWLEPRGEMKPQTPLSKSNETGTTVNTVSSGSVDQTIFS